MSDERTSTGVRGLDIVLNGGLVSKKTYLLRGDAGAGKTLLGLQFLATGVENDETALCVHLKETKEELEQKAAAVDIDTDGIEFFDMRHDAPEIDGRVESFSPAVDDAELVGELSEKLSDLDPDRVVVDPVTRLRDLFSTDERFREEAIGLARHLRREGTTSLFSYRSAEHDTDLAPLSDGTIELHESARKRTLEVPKSAVAGARDGTHGMRISDDGFEVFPALEPEVHERDFDTEAISSGIPQLDKLLSGGIERGAVTVVAGPTGVGKTTLGTQFMKEAAGRGERSVIYMFEESTETFRERNAGINVPVGKMVEQGALHLEEIEPVKRSAVEFADMVRKEVTENDTDIVMIDGIDGFNVSLRDDRQNLVETIQALTRFLQNMGVTVIIISEHDSMTGDVQATGEGLSYLADNVVLLQHLELRGEIRKAIGVLKKRTSDYERMLREFHITENGVKVGKPMENLQGVLTGTPRIREESD
ncbi:ATPase domain-containing protein [Halorussus halophilus]|uniref:ATPase domain-containing protein n=1 Tax=Halorussus halophilus TaxID=2650975 RepID=UPI001300F699|nr:ATPase domain-containing protein [Halorussus halophilus]